VLAVSFDARETTELAAAKKRTYVEAYRRGSPTGWHFLTGDQAAIDALTEAVGFKYRYESRTDQFIHASAIQVVAPGGRLARYFYGVRYSASDLESALADAAAGRAGRPAEQIFLYCFRYDPVTGRYGLVIMNVLRVASAATILSLMMFIAHSLNSERRGKRRKMARV
jgi:protein SCO1/2